jgi:hypothetical protein
VYRCIKNLRTMFVAVSNTCVGSRASTSTLSGQKSVEVDVTMSALLDETRPKHRCRLVLALMGAASAVAFLAPGTAYAHDPNRPALNGWFKSLKNKAGEPCCDSGDGEHAKAEWDMAKRGYRVLLKHPHKPNEPGRWFDVPYSAVLDQPNLSGVAMVWWWPSYSTDGSMIPNWRCFIPGAGS